MNYVTLIVGEDRYHLKATTSAKVDAEKILGHSLGEALDTCIQSRVISVVLWAAMQAYNHGIKLTDVYKILDKMELDGFSLDGKDYEILGIEEKSILTYSILKVSGFFTKAQILDMDEAILKVEPLKSTAEEDKSNPKTKKTIQD